MATETTTDKPEISKAEKGKASEGSESPIKTFTALRKGNETFANNLGRTLDGISKNDSNGTIRPELQEFAGLEQELKGLGEGTDRALGGEAVDNDPQERQEGQHIGPESQQAASDHPQKMPEHEKDVIRDLGLSFYELMVYRRTGELPDRAKDLTSRRFRAQTAPPRRALQRPERGAQRPPESFDEYKKSVLSMADQADRAIQSILDPDGEDGEFEIPKIGDSSYSSDERFLSEVAPVIKEKVERDEETIREAIVRGDLLPAKRAQLIETLYRLEGPIGRQNTTNLINVSAFNNDFGTIGKLLEYKDGCEHLSYDALLSKKGEMSEDELFGVTNHVVNNFEDHLSKIAKDGLEREDGYRYLENVFGQLKTHPDVVQRLVEGGMDFQQLADKFVGIFAQNINLIQGGEPSHGTTSVILDTMAKMYEVIPEDKRKKPEKLDAVLDKFYQEKVFNYSSVGDRVNYVDNHIRNVRRLFNTQKSD